MKNVAEAKIIQIDITNKCERACSNCTHLVKHVSNWEMDFGIFKKAVDSLVDFPGMIGIIGGNPVLHTRFKEFTEYLVKKIPNKQRRGLWTSGGALFDKKFCYKNYGFINFNSHKNPSFHQPILINPKDIIKNKKQINNYIDCCWLAEKWSPSINPKGCYRCEVMAAFDMVLNKNLGLPIKNGWWELSLYNFQKQIDSFCVNCSISIPLRARLDYEGIDDISKTNLKLFKNSLRIKKGKYLVSNNIDLIKDLALWKQEKYRGKKSFLEKNKLILFLKGIRNKIYKVKIIS